MNSVIRNTLLVLLGLVALYSIASIPLSDYLSGRYGLDWNPKRKRIGLEPLGKDWQLDSTVFIGFGHYSIADMQAIPHWKLWLENEKLHRNYWSPKIKKDLKHTKLICYQKSFWLWKNQALMEADYYKRQLDSLRYVILTMGFDYALKTSFARIDTLVNQKEADRIIAQVTADGYEMCGTAQLALRGYNIIEQDKGILEVTRAQDILEHWHEGMWPISR